MDENLEEERCVLPHSNPCTPYLKPCYGDSHKVKVAYQRLKRVRMWLSLGREWSQETSRKTLGRSVHYGWVQWVIVVAKSWSLDCSWSCYGSSFIVVGLFMGGL
jgi:hypothetical protein